MNLQSNLNSSLSSISFQNSSELTPSLIHSNSKFIVLLFIMPSAKPGPHLPDPNSKQKKCLSARQEKAKHLVAVNVVAASAMPSKTSSPKKSNVLTSHGPGGGRGKRSPTTVASPAAKHTRPEMNDGHRKTSNLAERRKEKSSEKDTPVEPSATTNVESLTPAHILRDVCKCLVANLIIMHSHSCWLQIHNFLQ